MKKLQKAVAIFAVGGLAAGFLLGGAAGFAMQPEPQVLKVVEYVDVPVEVIKEVEVLKEVNVSVEVPVMDLSFAALACDRLFYEDVQECQDEVAAEEAALLLAFAEIDSEGFDFLDDEALVVDEDELRVVRVYNDYEDINVTSSDYDDEEYTFELEVKIDDDEADEKINFIFEVDVEDGDAEIVDAWEV